MSYIVIPTDEQLKEWTEKLYQDTKEHCYMILANLEFVDDDYIKFRVNSALRFFFSNLYCLPYSGLVKDYNDLVAQLLRIVQTGLPAAMWVKWDHSTEVDAVSDLLSLSAGLFIKTKGESNNV